MRVFDRFLPTSEFLYRTILINPDNNSFGTGFLIPNPNTDSYVMITAAHVLEGLEEGKITECRTWQHNILRHFLITPYFSDKLIDIYPFNNERVDIAIAQTNIKTESDRPQTNFNPQIILGQEVLFLGFPFGKTIIDHPGAEINSGLAIPFIKRAIISSIQNSIIYLDGHANEGFSGSPILCFDSADGVVKICGIVCGCINEFGQILNSNTDVDSMQSIQNSGIIYAHSTNALHDLIIQKLNFNLF